MVQEGGVDLRDLPAPSAIRPVDLLTVVYLLLSGFLAALFLHPEQAGGWIALGHGTAALVLPFCYRALSGSDRRWKRALLEWYPFLLFSLFYLETGIINPGSPIPCIDPWLTGTDRFLFDETLSTAIPALLPQLWFREVMAFFYFSYYILIPGMGLVVWLRAKSLFSEYVLTVAACFYFCYLLFCLVPSAGPQFHLQGGRIVWEGYIFGPLLTEVLQSFEKATGAFPSSHVAVSLIALVFGWRLLSAVRYPLLVLFSGLFVSTVYGGPHYAIDLPAGLLVGWVFLVVVPRSGGDGAKRGLDRKEKKGNS